MSSSDSLWQRELPMFPLGSVVLPGVGIPLQVFEPRYRALVMTCLTEDRLFGSVLIERGSEVGGGDQRGSVGTLIRIAQAEEAPGGRWAVMGVGIERLRVLEWRTDDPYPMCFAEAWPDGDESAQTPDFIASVLDQTMALTVRLGVDGADGDSMPELDENPSISSFQLAALSPLGPLDRLAALKAQNPDARLNLLSDSLAEQFALLDAIDALDGNGGSVAEP